MASMQTRQTYDRNSLGRPVDTTDHQRNSARCCYCHHHRLDDDGRASAAELRWWLASTMWETGTLARSTHASNALSMSVASVLFAVLAHNRITCLSLSLPNEKHQGTTETKSWILHLRTESRKVPLKSGNILPTAELADASYCTQPFRRLCCETLKDWHIHNYTPVDHINGNSAIVWENTSRT